MTQTKGDTKRSRIRGRVAVEQCTDILYYIIFFLFVMYVISILLLLLLLLLVYFSTAMILYVNDYDTVRPYDTCFVFDRDSVL